MILILSSGQCEKNEKWQGQGSPTQKDTNTILEPFPLSGLIPRTTEYDSLCEGGKETPETFYQVQHQEDKEIGSPFEVMISTEKSHQD